MKIHYSVNGQSLSCNRYLGYYTQITPYPDIVTCEDCQKEFATFEESRKFAVHTSNSHCTNPDNLHTSFEQIVHEIAAEIDCETPAELCGQTLGDLIDGWERAFGLMPERWRDTYQHYRDTIIE